MQGVPAVLREPWLAIGRRRGTSAQDLVFADLSDLRIAEEALSILPEQPFGQLGTVIEHATAGGIAERIGSGIELDWDRRVQLTQRAGCFAR